MNREETIERLLINPKVSVLIIGAGISGVSTFRDLAHQGVDVLLVDRGDYCSGASGSSVYTLEENIRYPENGASRSMREVANERGWLLENMPHLVNSIPTVIPTFRAYSGLLKSRRKFPDLEIPLVDRGAKSLKKWVREINRANRGVHLDIRKQFLGRKQSHAHFPGLNRHVRNLGVYTDAAIPSPERICIEMIQDALGVSDTVFAANYVEMNRVEGNQVVLVDKMNDEQFNVEPSLVINATGPWVDETNQTMGQPSEFIAGSKSVHLVLEHPQLCEQLGAHAFRFDGQDTPSIYFFPLGDKVMIGSSGLTVQNRYHPYSTPEEIDHFFKLARLIFPDIALDRSQIIFQFAGLLPSLKDPQENGDSQTPRIEKSSAGTVAAFPVLTLLGGRWTSYWGFAEQVSDAVLDFFQIARQVDTKTLPVGGGRDLPNDTKEMDIYQAGLAEKFDAPAKLVEILVDRYGSRAEAFLGLKTLVSPTAYWPFSGYTPEEIALLAKKEDVIFLDDLILRRTMIGKLGMLDGEGIIALTEIVANAKGWSDEFKKEELDRCVTILRDRYGVLLRPD